MQHYLYEEIILQGFDGDKFGEYLQKRHPGAAMDLTIISFEELKTITADFKQAEAAP